MGNGGKGKVKFIIVGIILLVIFAGVFIFINFDNSQEGDNKVFVEISPCTTLNFVNGTSITKCMGDE